MEAMSTTAPKLLDRCNLIINYLPQDMDDHGLRALFQEYGEIVHAKVVRDRVTKKSLGFGFVKFATEQEATAAIQAMNGRSVANKRLKVSVARPSSDEIRNCKLYVTNLPKEMTDQQVLDLFAQFGEIIECRVLKDKDSSYNRGVAFVQYNIRSEATEALSLNGKMLDGSERPLAVKYAEDQHKKKERKQDGARGQGMRGRVDGGYGRKGAPQSASPNPAMPGYNRQSSFIAPGLAYNPTSGATLSAYDWYSQVAPLGYQLADYPGSRLLYPDMPPAVSSDPLQHNLGNLTSGLGNLSLDDPANNYQSVTLVVSNLPSNADVSILHTLFSPYGRIISAEIDVERRVPSGLGVAGRQNVTVCSGRGQVQMADYVQAFHAMRAVNGMVVYDRLIQVDMVNSDGVTVLGGGTGNHPGSGKAPLAAPSAQTFA